jgi:AcrR family transcriptional regulator
MTPARDAQPPEGDPRVRFKDRVKQWREEAILSAVAELLREEGCRELTMDQIARRVGVAKGSLYLHTTTRSGLLEQMLNRWASQVPTPDGAVAGDVTERLGALCAALMTPVNRGAGAASPAFPCCLHTSPCPHGWAERWAHLAAAYGLDTTPDAEVLGEALQALAATPHLRALVAEERTGEAQALLERFVVGFTARAQSARP